MGRTCFPFLVAVTVLACGASRSTAQPAPGVLTAPRPVFSPYLNLTRQDVDPAINYFGIVRPQIATANAIRSLQQQVRPSEQSMATGQGAVDPSLPVTGQPTYFLNTGGFFLNSRSGTAPLTNRMTTRPTPFTPTLPRAR